ncbi:class I SAM-dependent methyltransferase [Piscinibacter sp.]|uniref:class I SAM-dependent methyltransferase n=1 Tax=Piscinibacter sp. TaxID=1903157 RepID=UPI002C5F20B2|nr:class I SAM-dependent methyltransferase [Albitalea sp.]HUG25415.1 class I SAM-dependent methyltransferase [Albitalea sp.]
MRFSASTPENYEKYFVPAIAAPMAEDLMDAASIRPGERVLDVACGTGVVTRLAAERVGSKGQVAGLDVNPAMLAVARSLTQTETPIDWYETSADAMPLADDGFDVVLCQMGLQFMSNKRQALAEMRRVVRPGGRMVLNVPGPTPAFFSDFAQALARHIDPNAARFVDVVFSLHDAEELRSLMTAAGFEDVKIAKLKKTLRLPPPHEFVWQYAHSTPLRELVSAASDVQHDALTDEVAQRWQDAVADGVLTLDVDMTTVMGWA